MALCLRAIVTLLPLILVPYVLLYYDITPKIVVILTGTAVAALLTVREARARSPMLRAFGYLLLAAGFWLAVSTAFSKDPALSLGGGAWRRYGLITQSAVLLLAWIVAQHAAGRPERTIQLLRAMVAGGIPISIYAIFQYFGLDPIFDQSVYHAGAGATAIVRPPGTMGYASYLATYLLSAIFAGAALLLVDGSRIWRILGGRACFVGTAALILTGTRAAMLALVFGSLLLGVCLRPKIRARDLLAGFAVLAFLGVFYFSPAGQLLRGRTRWSMEDWAGGARPLLWRDSLRMARARWFVGFGPETFSTWFPRFQSAELARAFPSFFQESPHNVFLDALCDQGIPGLAVFVSVTAFGFYAAWKARSKLAKVLAAALASLVVSQQFTVFTAATAAFFYVTTALLVAESGKPDVQPVNRRQPPQIVAACLVAVAYFSFSATLAYADAGLARVNYLLYNGRVPEAVTRYQRVERWRPPGMRTDLWYSRAVARAAHKAQNAQDATLALAQGFEAAQRAVMGAEEPENAWLNLATFYGHQDDSARAEQALRSAVASAPSSYKPHWLLAQVLWLDGRLPDAQAEAERAVDLDGGKDPAVNHTLAGVSAAAEKVGK